jgi:hypothetical protein
MIALEERRAMDTQEMFKLTRLYGMDDPSTWFCMVQ